MKLFVVIPAFNEEKKIGKVISDLKKNNYKNIVIVDDGSEDKTNSVAIGKGVIVLRHIINRGQGASLKTGIDFAIQNKADIIVTFDADGQFLVKEIKNVVKPVIKKEAEVVLGSRFLGTAVNMPWSKKFVLKLGIVVVRILYGIKVTDSQSGFRALSRKAAKKIDITENKMAHAGEIFSEIMRNNLKYKEVPITIIYDKYALTKGQSWTRSLELGIKMIFRKFMR
jgi:glycosyltransferase involved in cell wall biosynthesis